MRTEEKKLSRKKSRESIENKIKNKEYKELGRFKNEHGEEYLIYQNEEGSTMFCGDETDWEGDMLSSTGFMFNDIEAEEIQKILKKNDIKYAHITKLSFEV